MNRGSIASFDPIWERLYSDGRHVNRYPFDEVVAFLFRHFPKEELRKKTNVLEVGFGAANNLWFAAREGFTVAGVESSTTAVRIAQRRFEEEKLRGDLRVGNFIQLPFGNDVFDVGINRAALTQTDRVNAKMAVNEVHRTLRHGGLFFNEFYSDSSSSRGTSIGDGLMIDIEGPLSGIGQVCFYGRDDIEHLFLSGWEIIKLRHVQRTDILSKPREILATWVVEAQKI